MTTASDLPDPDATDLPLHQSLEEASRYVEQGKLEKAVTALLSTVPEQLSDIYAALYVIAQNTAPKDSHE